MEPGVGLIDPTSALAARHVPSMFAEVSLSLPGVSAAWVICGCSEDSVDNS